MGIFSHHVVLDTAHSLFEMLPLQHFCSKYQCSINSRLKSGIILHITLKLNYYFVKDRSYFDFKAPKAFGIRPGEGEGLRA